MLLMNREKIGAFESHDDEVNSHHFDFSLQLIIIVSEHYC